MPAIWPEALWAYLVTGEFGLPTVYKPTATFRELRRLFSYYNLVTRQIRMLKNGIQALLVKNGITLEKKNAIIQYIILAGAEFQNQVELLITIRGITPLIALAFLADIGDISRFKST